MIFTCSILEGKREGRGKKKKNLSEQERYNSEAATRKVGTSKDILSFFMIWQGWQEKSWLDLHLLCGEHENTAGLAKPRS